MADASPQRHAELDGRVASESQVKIVMKAMSEDQQRYSMRRCCGYVAGCMPEVSPGAKFTVAKWFYRVGLIATTVLAWVLRDYSAEWLALNASSFQLCQGVDDPESCGGQQVAMRVSFANFCFFSLLGLLMLGSRLKEGGDPRVNIHGSLWLWKALLWACSIVGFFFIPSSALVGYAQVARIGSGAFLVLALTQILDVVYQVSEWLAAEGQLSGAVRALSVLLTVLLFGLGLMLLGLCYHFFGAAGSCSLNLWFITWSLLVMLALLGVLCLPRRAAALVPGAAADEAWSTAATRRRPSLISSGTVFLYTSILLASALGSEPEEYDCNAKGWTDKKWMQALMFAIQLCILVYSTLAASRDPSREALDPQDEPSFPPYRPDFFYMVFALASMFIGTLLSKWQVSPSSTEFSLDQGWAGTWVKMATKWVCEFLYLCAALAPVLCVGGTLVVRCDFVRYRFGLPEAEEQLLQRPAAEPSDLPGQDARAGRRRPPAPAAPRFPAIDAADRDAGRGYPHHPDQDLRVPTWALPPPFPGHDQDATFRAWAAWAPLQRPPSNPDIPLPAWGPSPDPDPRQLHWPPPHPLPAAASAGLPLDPPKRFYPNIKGT